MSASSLPSAMSAPASSLSTLSPSLSLPHQIISSPQGSTLATEATITGISELVTPTSTPFALENASTDGFIPLSLDKSDKFDALIGSEHAVNVGYLPKISNNFTALETSVKSAFGANDSSTLEVVGSGGSTIAKAVEKSEIPVIPLQGAWTKRLSIISEETSSELLEDVSLPSQWPSLFRDQQLTKRQLLEKAKNKATENDQSFDDIDCPRRIEHRNSGNAVQDQRFPWAAKMNPAMRNLYRATSPTYMDDGTPKVQIPSHVLLKGLENQKEFVIGQFYRCSTPSAGLIHAMVNKMWGRNCKIFIRKLGESSYMFHIPDKSTRAWVIQRGLWHIDDCLMFVASWNPAATLALPEISTMPVWVTLKNIPSQLYSIQGISWIASGLGAPMATNKPRLDPTLMGEAKILVEVELNKPFPPKIAAEDKKGTIWMIDVEYSWLPSKCGRCDQLGHKESRCLQHRQPIVVSPTLETLKSSLVPETSTYETTEEVNELVIPTTSREAIVIVSSDISLENTTMVEEVFIPLLRATTTSEETSYTKPVEVHETTIPLAAVTPAMTPIIEAGVTSSKIISTPKSSTFLSPQYLEVSSGNMKIPLVVESNVCETMIKKNGALSTPESSDTDVDLVTSSSQRILRERPVQPTVKYNDNEWISVSTCRRSKRTRGSRRGRLD